MIMTTTLSAVVFVEFGAPSSLANGAREIVAIDSASVLLDASFHHGLLDFKNVTSVASTTTNGITVSLNVTFLPDGFTKLLTSNAAWTDVEGRQKFISLHSLITDFAEVPQNFCSDVLTGDWSHPQEHTFTLISGDLLPSGFSPLHPISTLTVSNSTLVGGISTTSTKSDPSLFVFDISSTTEPIYLGSVDNASSTVRGVNDIAVSGNDMFVANAGQPSFATCKEGPSCSQLQIFDISNPSAPLNIRNLELSTTSAPFATGSGGQSIGKSIAYANGYVYLGLTKTGSTAGEEFNVIDIRIPQAPLWIGGFSVGRSINRIIVRGTFAYLATDDPTQEFIILDIHDPTNIKLVGAYDAPGASTFGYGNALAIEGSFAALGRTYTPNRPDLSLLSIASAAPQLVSSEQIASRLDSVNIQGLLVRDFLLFVLTSNSLESFDLHDTAHPSLYTTPFLLPTGNTGTSLTCRGNTLYVGSVGPDQTGYLTVITGS